MRRFPRLLLVPDADPALGTPPDDPKDAPNPAAAAKGRKDPTAIGLEKKLSQLEDRLGNFEKETKDKWGIFDGFMRQPSPRPPAPGAPRKTFADELCDFMGFGSDEKA